MEKKMLISELALAYGVSRPTLIYYDKIDLLVPYHDQNTGYRYYSIKDMEKLELILTLKKIGLSLKDIKKSLDNPTHQLNINLLQLRKIELQQKIIELQHIEQLLDKRISLLKPQKNKTFKI
jgi:DNA-binding transcriptional MerR regulator